MKFEQFYSGSEANAYVVTAQNGQRLLLECGVRWTLLQKKLGYNLRGIEGCFLTHNHADHSKALNNIVVAGIDTYASEGTINALDAHQWGLHTVKSNDLVNLNSFQVFCFDTLHDTPEPLGFIVLDKCSGEFLLFATDTKCIKQRFPYRVSKKQFEKMTNSDKVKHSIPFSIIAIEASYCGETLARKVKEKIIPESLAKRLLDSHMEIKETMRYIDEFCNRKNCHEIHLLHMSGRNSDHHKSKKAFYEKFGIETITIGS